jgi:hypothetical protein
VADEDNPESRCEGHLVADVQNKNGHARLENPKNEVADKNIEESIVNAQSNMGTLAKRQTQRQETERQCPVEMLQLQTSRHDSINVTFSLMWMPNRHKQSVE